jgi:L-aminopeptidase/D-esterase-like protein
VTVPTTAGPVIPDGFRIGHWTDAAALTGCTVILCPPRTAGGADVRGSSPGSREIALLASEKSMQEVHALLLTGGSAFGLAAADGVMRWLEEHGVGYQTPWAKVPIVPAAVIFDLNIGSSAVRPGPDSGYAACAAAGTACDARGNIGAGTGATVGKWGGMETRMKGGLGVASTRVNDLVVAAVAVVNAVGDILDTSGSVFAGARSADGRWLAEQDPLRTFTMRGPFTKANTTLVAVLSNARVTKVDANRVAQRAHDGMARAIKPVHTSYDGDVTFTLASGQVETSVDILAEIGAEMTAAAIRDAVRSAATVAGVAGLRG